MIIYTYQRQLKNHLTFQQIIYFGRSLIFFGFNQIAHVHLLSCIRLYVIIKIDETF